MDGFEDLGALIVGAGAGPDNTSKAYIEGLRGGYQVQTDRYQRDKMREDARIMRARAIARDALPEAIRTAGYDPKVQPLVGAILGANQTIDLDQLGKLALPGSYAAYTAGADKLRTGDVAGYNDELAIASGKEREPYSVAAGGDVVFRADTGDVALTDLGDAALNSENALALARQATAAASAARARANDASAGAATALADLRGRTDPNRPRTTSRTAPGATPPNPAVATGDAPPAPGARKAPDGRWYLPDPARPGKWLLVEP